MAMTGQGPIGKLSGAFRLFVVWIRDSLPSPVFVDLQPFGIMFGCLASGYSTIVLRIGSRSKPNVGVRA